MLQSVVYEAGIMAGLLASINQVPLGGFRGYL